tara:strand:- start:520 stop:1014 length:495 start_codon:yes stop_codon:yes gene_type:complete
MITEITQKVSINSKYLDSNISHHLLKKIEENMEGKCYLDYGYIIKVKNIIDIGSNIISPSTLMAVYTVKYEADVIKPVKGLILSGKICMLFKQGIFVNILDKMKVLIPENNIEGYKFNDDIFVSEDEDKDDLVINTNVEIEITMVKYEKKSFSCIGKFLSTTKT